MGIADLPRPVGYVLGGGGSLGAIQVGMLQALAEHDIAPDMAMDIGRSSPICTSPVRGGTARPDPGVFGLSGAAGDGQAPGSGT